MRLLSGLFLLTLIAVVGLLSYENNVSTNLTAWTYHVDVPVPVLVVAVYVLGMLSGWWLVGMMKRSWQRITEPDRVRA